MAKNDFYSVFIQVSCVYVHMEYHLEDTTGVRGFCTNNGHIASKLAVIRKHV